MNTFITIVSFIGDISITLMVSWIGYYEITEWLDKIPNKKTKKK